MTVSVTVPDKWDTFKGNIDSITSPFRQIASAVSSTITVLNALDALAQLAGIINPAPDPFQTLQSDIDKLGKVLTWKADGQAAYNALQTYPTAFNAISRDAARGIKYDFTDDSYTPTVQALHELSGVDPTSPGTISLFSSYGRSFDEAATGATDSDINWKWAIAPVAGKTRPAVQTDSTGDSLVYDWRLALPAFLRAIPLRIIVVSADDPNFRADLSSSQEFEEARSALLLHYKTMLAGVVCGYKTFAATSGPGGIGSGSNDSCAIECADMYTGLQAATAIFQQGTCEDTIGFTDVYPKSIAQSRSDVASHMPFFDMDAAINQLYLLDHPGPDLTQINHRIALANTNGTSLCVTAQSSAVNATTVLATCDGSSGQKWIYDREAASVTNPVYGTCLAVQRDGLAADMTTSTTQGQLDSLYGYSFPVISTACIANEPSQKWTYDPENKRLLNGVGANLALTSGDLNAPLTAATTVAFIRTGTNQNQWAAETTPVLDSTNDPAISSRGSGTLDVFAIADGRMFQRSYAPGWQPWVQLPPVQNGGYLVGRPAAVSWDSSRNDVFAHDNAGNTLHLWATNGVWATAWETIATGASCGLSCVFLTASSWGPNRLDVFDIASNSTGTARTIEQITYDNGWQAPTFPFGEQPPATLGIAAVSWGGVGRIDLFAVADNGDSGVDQYYTNNGSSWGGPFHFGIPGGPITFASNVALSSWGPGVLDIVTMGADFAPSAVGQLSYRPDTGWKPWATPTSTGVGPAVSAPISSVSSGPNRIDVVFSQPVPGGNGVGHAWYNEVAPVGWFGTEPL